jgi:hypothetical protein
MYSTPGFVGNGLLALVSSFFIFPAYFLIKSFGSEKIDSTDLRNHLAVVTGGNTGFANVLESKFDSS